MSYAYRYSVKAAVQPKRPHGVAVLAVLGILVGIAEIVLVLSLAWFRLRQGLPPASQLAALGIGLGLGWLIIRINWGLLDLMRWAWWMSMILGTAAAMAFALMLRPTPALASFLPHSLPDAIAQRLAAGPTVVVAIILICNVAAMIYLLSARKAFGIGTQDRRPPWEQ
jgi:hypothetical protein